MPRRRKDKNGKDILTVREKLLVEGVAQGKSITQAALDAGYSSETAAAIGSENLKKPEVSRYLQERVSTVAATTDEVLSLLAMHLRTDIADFEGCVKEDGSLDLKEAKKRGISRLVKKVKTKVNMIRDGESTIPQTTTEVEFHDSQAAAWKLAELLGMKKEPGRNPEDVARVKIAIETLMRDGWTLEQAREIVLEAEPRAAQWIN
jgi:phage terminase small subunit